MRLFHWSDVFRAGAPKFSTTSLRDECTSRSASNGHKEPSVARETWTKSKHPITWGRLVFVPSLLLCTMVALKTAFSLLLLPLSPPVLAATSTAPEALNTQLTNSIGDNGGPVLYYNGSGPVPPYAA